MAKRKATDEQVEESKVQENEEDIGQQDHVKIVYPVPGATDTDAINPTPEETKDQE